MHTPNAPPLHRKPDRGRGRHPVLLFILVAALALGAAASLLWVDVVAQSADALNVKDPATLLPP
ncbi:hypothetical protein [Comamonas sp. 17RB]|uniref:hypothetical protein n=1 Tax=Comamonas sp. 17RB TaxID=3047025 RepID=UPI0024B6BB24|nr:hypothetical protein [Comamonas sp. 17RB]MDI9855543.1 hypothetical protein [Comamonas sp. 17RB]